MKSVFPLVLLATMMASCQKSGSESSAMAATGVVAEFVFGYSCKLTHVISEQPLNYTEASMQYDGATASSLGESVELDGYKAVIGASKVEVNGFKTAQLLSRIEKMSDDISTQTEYSSIPASTLQTMKTENDGKFFLRCDRIYANSQLILNSNH